MRSLRPKVLSRKPKPVPGWCKSLLLKKARTESTKLIEDSHLWLIVYIVPFRFWRKCIPRLRKGSAGSDDFPREPYALWRKGNRPIKETFAPPESQIDVDDRGRADAVNRAYSFSLASLLEHLPYLRTSRVIPYLFRFLALYWWSTGSLSEQGILAHTRARKLSLREFAHTIERPFDRLVTPS